MFCLYHFGARIHGVVTSDLSGRKEEKWQEIVTLSNFPPFCHQRFQPTNPTPIITFLRKSWKVPKKDYERIFGAAHKSC